MCIAFISYENHPDYKLIVASNRDEFLERPTAKMHIWDNSGIIAGKDLTHGGTWLGAGWVKFGLITNYRDFHHPRLNGPSRGLLLSSYLTSSQSAEEFLAEKEAGKSKYDGYNLVIMDESGLYYQSSKLEGFEKLKPGYYSLSNAFLDTPWPKIQKGKKLFIDAFKQNDFIDNLFRIMKDEEKFPFEMLPDTGIGTEMEHWLSSIFINGDKYGTRVTTIVTLDHNNRLDITELTHADGTFISFTK